MIPLHEYDYELPAQLIAQEPVQPRDACRLMVLRRSQGGIEHRRFDELPELLREGDCVVLNDTRVVAARLVGRRLATGGRWEGLFLREEQPGRWALICQTRGKLRAEERIGVEMPRPAPHAHDHLGDQDVLVLELIACDEQGQWLAHPLSNQPAAHLLERYGRVPLPPYIQRSGEQPEDRQQYQTVFARQPGAVAAPTAGLHFTPQLLQRLQSRGIRDLYVTLHVGLGTFKPIETSYVEEHRLHGEWGCLSGHAAEQILECRRRGGRVMAVGTTTIRLLESAGRGGRLHGWTGETDLYIYPPFEFQVVDGLVTNFHLPRTSLLVLASTFGGRDFIRQAYREAIQQRYRFYSYGDAMLIL